jgi:hypothetical protein
LYPPFGQLATGLPDPPSVEFAGESRRWVRSRTNVLQVFTNKEDSIKSTDPKGDTVFKALAAINEEKRCLIYNDKVKDFAMPLSGKALRWFHNDYFFVFFWRWT